MLKKIIFRFLNRKLSKKETLLKQGSDAIVMFSKTVDSLSEVNKGLAEIKQENLMHIKALNTETEIVSSNIEKNQNIIQKINNIIS